jgi:TfoX/Sxy family transcriptional regulator of competence genes
MAKKKSNENTTEAAKVFAKLVALFPEVELKGASMPYTSLNGNMFAFASAEGLIGIRLPEDVREEFLKKYNSTLFHTHGTILKEYVTIPEKLLGNTKELKKLFTTSFEYAKTLKSKPTRSKSKH